jgi:hypothetical protein
MGYTVETINAFYPRLNNLPFNVISQNYPSLGLWQTLSRIVITTTIQLEKESIITRNNQGGTNRQEILTDFEIPQTEGTLRENVYFNAGGSNRWANFKSSGWLDRFDCKIFFQTKDLEIFPLLIPPTFEVSMKLEFKRRKAKELLQYTQAGPNTEYF